MATTKTSVAYRLSDQALANLESITQKTGTNKTAVVELAIALLANQIIGDTKMENLSLGQVLRTKFSDAILSYVGTIFGDDASSQDDPDRNKTGGEWADALDAMGCSGSFLTDHPDTLHAPDGGFYSQSGDIWYRGRGIAAERVFIVA